jgi:hypothetical protein
MNANDVGTGISEQAQSRCIVVEVPEPWGDAKFLGGWLVTAAKAQVLWEEAKVAPGFAKCSAIITDNFEAIWGELDLGKEAFRFLLNVKGCACTFIVDLNTEEGDPFVLLARLGLFVWLEDRYKLGIPDDLTLEKVKAAVIDYAKTAEVADPDFAVRYVIPDHFIDAPLLSLAQARDQQRRIEAAYFFRNNIIPATGMGNG